MELVVGEAVKSEKSRRNRGWVWPGRIAIMLATPALLFATAFGVIRKIQTNPDRVLIKNLSVIENHPRYDSIECDLDFLQRLSDLKLFSSSNTFVEHGETIIETTFDTVQGPDHTLGCRSSTVANDQLVGVGQTAGID